MNRGYAMAVEAHEPTVEHFVRVAQDRKAFTDADLVKEFVALLQNMDRETIDKSRAAIKEHRGEEIAQKAVQELIKAQGA